MQGRATESMKLVVVAANWPHTAHSVRGANVLVFELIRALADQPNLSVGFLKVGREGDEPPNPNERSGLAALKQSGVEVLPALPLPRTPRLGGTLSKLLMPRVEHFYPDVVHGPAIAAALTKWHADALLVPLSEWLTAACSTIPVTRFAYYATRTPNRRAGGQSTIWPSAVRRWPTRDCVWRCRSWRRPTLQ
jgi:hypothetical protein